MTREIVQRGPPLALFFKNLLFTALVPGTVAVYVPLRLASDAGLAQTPLLIGGVLVLAVGGLVYAWCVWEFATRGGGTPAPIDSPKALVVRGLYRYVRNPMYVGVLSVIFGWALLYGSKTVTLYGVVVAACFHAVVLLYEEPTLQRRFGAEYEAYCLQVARWVPRLRNPPGQRTSPGTVACLFLLSGCATGTGHSPAEEPNCAWRACLGYVDNPSGRTYRIENDEPVPVTVRLTFRTLMNLRPQGELPVERIVPPRSSATLIRLTTVHRNRSIGAEPSLAIDLGSDSTVPDSGHLYAVPFGGIEPRQLIQGFHGPDTHLGGMRYSLDFAMPEGTPVLAARSGIVVHVQDGFTEGGNNPDLLERANIVVVAHADGSMASYGHLAPGISVTIGESVNEGDRLALSGATGFAAEPHLHFHVGKRLLGDPHRTVPIQLRDHQGRTLTLEPGSLVAPAASSTQRAAISIPWAGRATVRVSFIRLTAWPTMPQAPLPLFATPS